MSYGYGLSIIFMLQRCIDVSQLDLNEDQRVKTTKSIEAMALDYEDDKNSLIAITEKGNNLYDDFYIDNDYRIRIEESMNMIFFGPSSSFIRLDSESILHIITHTKTHLIPISRALLAWDLITDGKTAAFVQGKEFLSFSSLLNVIPEEDLYYVNFGDPSVLRYFANNPVELHKRKYGILASSYRRYFGDNWYTNSTYINELGYLICGFPSSDLKQIPPKVFKDINTDVFGKLTRCNIDQTKTLFNIATHLQAYGHPYKWTSYEVGRIGSLFSCLPKGLISAIKLEAITALTPKVIKSINQEKLEFFTKEQILRMCQKTRRIYILRMQLRNSLDMSQIVKHDGVIFEACHLLVLTNIVALQLLQYY